MTELVEEQTEFPIRQVFIVSDGTAITAETLAHAITTQFPDLQYQQTRMPFVNTVEKARDAALTINRIGEETGTRPIIFTTFVEPDIMRTFNEHVQGHIIDLFRKFVGPLETELGMKCAHSVGQSHRIRDDERYNKRIAAIDYTLQHDDGQTNRGLDEADVIRAFRARARPRPRFSSPCSTASRSRTIRSFRKTSSAARFPMRSCRFATSSSVFRSVRNA